MHHVVCRFILRIGSIWDTFSALRKVENGNSLNGECVYLLYSIISNCYRSVKAFIAVITQRPPQQS